MRTIAPIFRHPSFHRTVQQNTSMTLDSKGCRYEDTLQGEKAVGAGWSDEYIVHDSNRS